jgi:DUF971 family protein
MYCEPWPSQIVVNQRAGELELTWNAQPAVLSGQRLREACRCSGCESARRHGDPPRAGAELRLLRVQLLGSSGLQCVFSDGHERGIYPWPYLHALAFAGAVLETKGSVHEQ